MVKARWKKPPDLVQKRFRGNSGKPTSINLDSDWLLWEPGAGGWLPGGSETAGKAQG